MTKIDKSWMRIGLTALALLPGPALAADSGLTGNWVRDNGTVKMEVSQCGNDLCAVNTWVKRPKGSEKVGDKIILSLRPVSSSEFQGRAYDVRRQMTYGVTVTLEGTSMETSGCVLFGIICRSTGWKRIN
jgi:uncharacterized protein (DUF2147 family)